jgi:hypothetical protein
VTVPWKLGKKPYIEQEKRTAKKAGARPQLNSGRTWSGKGDVRQSSPVGHLLIDNKTTETMSVRFSRDDFIKLEKQANRTPPGCSPMFQIDIAGLRTVWISERLWDETMKYIMLLEAELAANGS